MTDLRQAAQQALEALEWHYRQGHSNTLGGLRLKIDEKTLRTLRKALEQPEQDPVAWDKPSASFNEWWNGDYDNSANPFHPDATAYWAWAGWKAAQRQWVGLTDEDFLEACQIAERGNYLLALRRIQQILKAKNDH
jgi:hypothetical protein